MKNIQILLFITLSTVFIGIGYWISNSTPLGSKSFPAFSSSPNADSKFKYQGDVSYENFTGENLDSGCNVTDKTVTLKSETGNLLWQKSYLDEYCQRRIEGYQRPYPELTQIVVILKDGAFLLSCESNKNNTLNKCFEKTAFQKVTIDNFLLLDKNQQFLLSSPNMAERNKVTIINLENSREETIALQYQFAYPYGGGFTALDKTNSFAFWSDKTTQSSFNSNEFQPLISIYSGKEVSYIDNVPKTIRWGKNTYSIDSYGPISLKNNKVCFNWTVSSGQGIFVKEGAVFVQDPNGITDCAKLQ